MTGHGKRRAGARWAKGEDDESAAELDWLSWELWVPSCQNLNHPPLSRWNQLFHWNFLEKYFGSSASKKMTRQMLSLCHHLLTTDGRGMLVGFLSLTKHPPLSGWNQLRNIFGSSASKQMIRQMLSLCHHLPTTACLLVMFAFLHLHCWPKIICVPVLVFCSLLYFTSCD